MACRILMPQVKVKVKSLSRIWLFVTPWTVAYQAPPSMGFPKQEYWSGLLFSSPRDLPGQGIEPGSPALQAHALPSEPPGKSILMPHPGIKLRSLAVKAQSPNHWTFSSCCYSVIQSCPTLCNPMDCSMPGFPVLDHLLELAQTQVRWVGDAIQPSCLLGPLLLWPSIFPSIRVGSLHQVAKILEFLLQHQAFQWIFSVDFLQDWPVWFPCCPRDSQECSPAPQFKSISSSVPSLLYGPTLTSIHDYWKNHSFDYMNLCWRIDVSAFYFFF